MTCILCTADTETLRCFANSVSSEGKLIPAVSALHVCAACGHLQTTIDVDLERYYAEHYDATLTDEGHDEIVSTADGQIVFRTDLDYALMQRHLGDALSLQRAPSIFEYGCGHGRILSRLSKAGHRRLAAYDVSELYREAVSRFVPAESLFIGQRPESETFDVVISFFVLEHDTDPVGSLLYLRQRLAPDGLLYLMVPNYLTNAADLACADHVNHYSSRLLAALLEACGLRPRVLDDTSTIGAMAVVAVPSGPPVARPDVALAEPERVAYSRAACADFLGYMQRLEALAHCLQGTSVALYGAGFYAVLVQSQLKAVGARVTDVFDANPRKQGASRLGLTVRSPDELASGAWSDTDLVMCINPQIAASVGRKYAPYVRSVHVI